MSILTSKRNPENALAVIQKNPTNGTSKSAIAGRGKNAFLALDNNPTLTYIKTRKETMRYKYTITDETGKAEEVEAMSWKKMLKNLLVRNPKFSGWITYINKKENAQTKAINNGKVIHESK